MAKRLAGKAKIQKAASSDAPLNDVSSASPARAQKAAARREAILSAALDEFSARGFASARLDDIAERAGVAKGTIYLYFADKEALFQDIVRTMIVPVVAVVEHVPPPDVPIRAVLENIEASSGAAAAGDGVAHPATLFLSKGLRTMPNQ